MAIITIPAEARQIQDCTEIKEFLAQYNIEYDVWPLEDRVNPAAPAEDILSAYKPEIDVLKEQGGFVTADVIDVYPDTPNLGAMLDKFNKEHTHTEDEVRFILQGSGVFHINPGDRPVFGIEVWSGDMISVPLGTRHWFDLCKDRRIRAIRLFQDQSGWTPHYLSDAVHEGYEPLCLGPAYLDGTHGASS
ncbi:MAG: acireductone dioxygenase [Planctomycetes bacterium]|jgi:1,2-dihydroxy-3-keto-5-methylthiopentene dioxygenase|nr:acireductone dioxygenase [Planctomycetota bacterium]MBL6910252.1 acireductone dioxygenase [Pirellulales bacterium]OUV73214.1 MAG: acireductone dioxygenase [Planctomycetaceae bacterium TMED138]RZO63551.1 MAG: acireductone dioxygenase [Phycisphaeraceae bacterium]HAU48449.1 acireductone dioxygenase [Planctomycetaceae bacterium]|tara:strand:+ start:966 stop:1535 length:570 start_codon:yes stop_codon:yes gene_type:complete